MPLLTQDKLIAFADIPESLLAFYEQLKASAILSSPAAAAPCLLHLAGIPGAGKSTYAHSFQQQNQDFVLVQFDAVMEALPVYQQEKSVYGAKTAFANWEKPAASIGYHLLQALLEARRNILFDHSAAVPAHLELIEKVKSWGYKVEMHYLPCNLSMACKRVAEREKQTGRHTPKELIKQRLSVLPALLPHYQKRVDRYLQITPSLPQPVQPVLSSLPSGI